MFPPVPRKIAIVAALGALLALAPAALAAAQGRAAHPAVSLDLHEMDNWGEHARAAKTMLVLFQLAAVLAAAKVLGWLAEKVHVPGVIGELLAGVVIGP